MARVGIVVAILAFLGLAGCFGGSPANPDETGVEVEAGPLEITTDMMGCNEVLALILVDPDHARRFLPPGFEPADASSFVGVPATVGRAIVAMNAIECQESAAGDRPAGSAELLVVVEPPEIEGLDVDPALRHAYLVHGYTMSPVLVEAVNATGMLLSEATIDVTLEAVPELGTVRGVGVVSDGEGEIARFEVTSVPGALDEATSTLYQVAPAGLVVHAFAWDPSPLSAGTIACAVRAGSLAADVLGGTRCEDLDAVGLTLGPVDFQSKLRYGPGAQAVE